MNLRLLTHRNTTYYHRYYRLVMVAALITTAVITGSLMVGDSVRHTLTARVDQRLGNTQSLVFAREGFVDASWGAALARRTGARVRSVLLVNGFVSHDGRLTPVTVWGVDDLHMDAGTARINHPLARRLDTPGSNRRADLVLRLPATGLIPSGSLFVTDQYTTSLRLQRGAPVDIDEGGNLSLKNEQTLPLNIFVDRAELAEALGVGDKVNLLLADRQLTDADLRTAWNGEWGGLSVGRGNGFSEITTDRLFLPTEVTQQIVAENHDANRLFSYLANTLEHDGHDVPYSFVTALDRFDGEPLAPDDILLTDYTARRLHAAVGDRITLTYFVASRLKTLHTDTLTLRVRRIVPIAALQADTTLTARFPGMTDATRCTDWSSDLPIDLLRITPEDERYWETFRATPKALIAYNTAAPRWSNVYGNATAVRVADTIPHLDRLQPAMFGLTLIHPRQAALYAARNGVDFGGLFLALGCFIIVAALLLLTIPLSEMCYKRRDEFALLAALGYTRRRITALLWREAMPRVLFASLLGVAAGIAYTTLVMWLLGNVWQGATHTDGFVAHPTWITMLVGMATGALVSLLVLWRVVAGHERHARGNTLPSGRRSHLKADTPPLLTLRTLSFAGLRLNRRQALRSFWALTLGVFIVFTVGLHRQGFSDSNQLRTATAGYALWCESSVPIYHNLDTPEGRAKLSLSDLPADVSILQCLRYTADEASCLNLNKVSTPTVLGVDADADELFAPLRTALAPTDSVYPALVDATVLTWILGRSLGDTLYYTGDGGKRIAVRLAGTLPNTIFQGNILMNRDHFARCWKEITGSEVLLFKLKESERTFVQNLLEQALNEYGVLVTPTNERLRQFNSVTDTYLTIFLTLGGLGLLLGIVAFVIVVRKNLAMCNREIALYRTLGFADRRIAAILYRENLLVPMAAIGTGVLCALASVSFGLANIGTWLWLLVAAFVALLVYCALWFVRRSVDGALKASLISNPAADR
ncbi:MAG: ABC transporter permease [Prevotellaceae bacterium]|jgi:putative ABC transport system permease protein|nr:ABC transporter permease [Prevotellaceae bacterium]